MKTQDQPQDLPGLGKKIVRPAMPERHEKVRDGVFKGPDGKLYTDLKEPPEPPLPTIWDVWKQVGMI